MGVAPVPTIGKAQKTRRPARRTFMRALPHLVPCVIYVVYLVAGSLVFLLLEGNNTELKEFQEMVNDTKNQLHGAIVNASKGIQNDTNWEKLLENYTTLVTRPEWKLGRYENLRDGLSFSSSMLFCLITITTIGYGDIVPISTNGRIFVSLYAAIGIPLNVIFLADVGYLFAKLIVKVIRGIKMYQLRRKRAKEPMGTLQPGKTKPMSKFRRKKYAKRGKKFKNIQKHRSRAAVQTPKGGISASRDMSIHAHSALHNNHNDDNSKDTSFTKENHVVTTNGEQDAFESVDQNFLKANTIVGRRKAPKVSSGGLSASRNMSVHARSLRRRSPDNEGDNHYARRPRGRRGAAGAKRKGGGGHGGGISASQHMSVHARSIMQRNLPEDIDSEETTSNDEPIKTVSGGLESVTNDILVNDVSISMPNSKSDVDLVGNEQLSNFDHLHNDETISAFGGGSVSMASEATDKSSLDDDDDDDSVDTEVPTILVLIILISYICIGAVMMMYVEEWDYGKALYFTIITLTTIGFGDIAPDKNYNNTLFIACIIYTIFGLAVMSTCIALVQAKVLRAIDKITRKIRKHAEI